MILYPAIDLKGGACVRLEQGEMDRATVFNADPAAQGASFQAAGAAWLHVVDLDGAFAGKPANAEAVAAILKAVAIPVQLGGGIRDMATVEGWLDRGVSRVILGTAAAKNPALVQEACRRFPGRVAVGIDARGGRVAVAGWAETTDIAARDLALRFEDAGIAAIIHTDIDRDGVLSGPNLAASMALAKGLSTPVIVSGGIASLDDLAAIRTCGEPGISGAISGRALYDGRIDLAAALALFREGETRC